MGRRRSALVTIGSVLLVATLMASSTGSVAAGRQAVDSESTAASKARSPWGSLELTYGEASSRGRVNVERLAKLRPTKRPHREAPYLTRPTSDAPKPDTSNGSRVSLASAPAPVLSTTNTDAPAAQTGFEGLAVSSGPSTSNEPPDPWLAVGPEHVVQVVNTSMRITDRQGSAVVDDVALADFFQLPTDPATFNTDPRVIYDSLHGRWLATEVSWDCEPDPDIESDFGTGYIDFAVSRTSDPTGIWDSGFIYFPDALPDYAAPGTSTDKIALASNLFSMGPGLDCLTVPTFAAADVVYMDWADVLNGGSPGHRRIVRLRSIPPAAFFTPRAAVQIPAKTARMHHVVQFDDGWRCATTSPTSGHRLGRRRNG